MKITIDLISLSAGAAITMKGERVVVRMGKNDWLVGTVTRAGAKIYVAFDDGSSAVVEAPDFKHVKVLTAKNAAKKVKSPLTDEAAKMLFVRSPTAKAPAAARTPAARAVKPAPTKDEYAVLMAKMLKERKAELSAKAKIKASDPEIIAQAKFLASWSKGKPITPADDGSSTFHRCGKLLVQIEPNIVIGMKKAGYLTQGSGSSFTVKYVEGTPVPGPTTRGAAGSNDISTVLAAIEALGGITLRSRAPIRSSGNIEEYVASDLNSPQKIAKIRKYLERAGFVRAGFVRGVGSTSYIDGMGLRVSLNNVGDSFKIVVARARHIPST